MPLCDSVLVTRYKLVLSSRTWWKYSVLCQILAPRHMWGLSTLNRGNVTEQLNFKFYLMSIYIVAHGSWFVATILDRKVWTEQLFSIETDMEKEQDSEIRLGRWHVGCSVDIRFLPDKEERAFWGKGALHVNAERLWHMEGKLRISHNIQNG